MRYNYIRTLATILVTIHVRQTKEWVINPDNWFLHLSGSTCRLIEKQSSTMNKKHKIVGQPLK
jgi:hypothetical protein